jgi:hypothetical protein
VPEHKVISFFKWIGIGLPNLSGSSTDVVGPLESFLNANSVDDGIIVKKPEWDAWDVRVQALGGRPEKDPDKLPDMWSWIMDDLHGEPNVLFVSVKHPSVDMGLVACRLEPAGLYAWLYVAPKRVAKKLKIRKANIQ